jgi:aminoglycoside 6-adenylyltransferase
MTSKSSSEVKELFEELIDRFKAWAKNRPDIRIAIVLGSRARIDHPADEWADLDIAIATTDPEYYLSASDWIENFGRPLLTFIEPTSGGGEKERRVLYEKMLDVDFAIFPLERIRDLLGPVVQTKGAGPDSMLIQISNMLGRGVRILVDKDGTMSEFIKLASSAGKPPPAIPTQDEFLAVVNDFLYHAVFTAKHLRRGELWWTVTCLDCYMQHLLLRMIEWHALVSHDLKHETWFRGRFLEEWAPPKTVKALQEAFAHYDKVDVKHALLAGIDLFRWLAAETAAKLNYAFPAEADKNVTEWIETCLSEL